MTGREYGPTAGIKPLRAAVANLYNANYRQGKQSQYSWENVCIVPGGRAGLIRIAAVLGNAYLGFFIPDYTAYNEMLSLFKNVSGDAVRRVHGAHLPQYILRCNPEPTFPSPSVRASTNLLH
jgi:aspartate/methionine/tyrosine aminotransferase